MFGMWLPVGDCSVSSLTHQTDTLPLGITTHYIIQHNLSNTGIMAADTATNYHHTSLSSDVPLCVEHWARLERKAFPESVSSQPDPAAYHSNGNSKGSPDVAKLTSQDPPDVNFSKHLLTGEQQWCTPWRTKDYSCDSQGLHDEINDFYEYIKPRPSELRMRVEVIQRVMNVVLYHCPYARIESFGSFITGLSLPTSDLDLVVFCHVQPSLFSIVEDFKAHDIAMEGSVYCVEKTAVPIIKFVDKKTQVNVDIIFNRHSGLASAEVTCRFVQMYPYLPKLVMVLKQFLVQRSLNEVFKGGISSYSLILMVVSFLQLHPQQATSDLAADLGKLLIEFFELYGKKFNYVKTGICVEGGGNYISKEDFDIQDMLYIKDPADTTTPPDQYPLDSNAGRGCFGIWQVKHEFEHAFTRLTSAVLSRESPAPRRDSLLGAVVKVSKHVDDYRNWTDSNWPTHPLSPPTSLAPVYYPAPSPMIIPTLPLAPPAYVQYSPHFTPMAISNELEYHISTTTSSLSHSSDHTSIATPTSNTKS